MARAAVQDLKISQLEFTRFAAAMSRVDYHYGTEVVPFTDLLLHKVFCSGNLAGSCFFTLSGTVAAISVNRVQM